MLLGHLLLVTTILLHYTTTASHDQLDYDNQDEWYTDCLTGEKQSPIDVITPNHFTSVRGALISLPADAQTAVMVNENNANTIKYEVTPSMKASVPGLSGVEVDLVQLHIHWGRNDKEGSEHWLNGDHLAAECHLVTSYTSDAGATLYVVFARLFEVGDENPQVAQMIAAAEEEGSARDISSFDLTALYPSSISRVLTYEGSFTTPNCDEKAYWVIVPELLEISSEQLDTLRDLDLGDGSGEELEYNWRNLQQRNGRKITGYKSRGKQHAA